MATTKVLLDTTMQLHRIADAPQIKLMLSLELNDKEVFTTSFVFREFLRTIIQDVAYVHASAGAMDEQTDGRVALANLSRMLASGKGNFSARSAQRMHLVMGALLAEFEQTNVSRQRLLTRLERIGQQWVRDFFTVLDADGRTCIVECLEGPDDREHEIERLKQGDPFPTTPLFPAAAAAFLDSHRFDVDQVEKAMNAAKSNAGKDQNLLKVLARMKNASGHFDFSSRLTPRTRGNWCLGDLLIALETPSDVAIYTTDRHYDVLCAALGKKRHFGYSPHDDTP